MKPDQDYIFICEIDQLKESSGKRFYINDTDVAVFKIEEKVFAVSNVCPHQQAANIFEGFVENECIVCPLHGWKFKLSDGKLASGSSGLDTYPIKIIDGKVYVKVLKKEFNW